MGIEKREKGEIRKTEDTGIVDAYLTAWGVKDSHDSIFKRGAFKKTFKEDFANIRLLWNHDELAGKVIEAREDDYGAFVRCQFNMDTEIGKRAFAHIKAGDIKCFSFGFYTRKDEIRNGIREISDVQCVECSPVVFEANHEAKIVNIRAEKFKDTLSSMEKNQRGYMLINALLTTLDDIMWNSDSKEWVTKIDTAIAKFHDAYVKWVGEIATEGRDIPVKNDLQKAFQEFRQGKSLEQLAMESPFTLDELRSLSRGELVSLEKREHLEYFSKEIKQAHDSIRHRRIEDFCNELRAGGIRDIEKARFRALLGKSFEEIMIEDIKKYREAV